MSESSWSGKRKKRPRSRVIADMSVNFLERQVLLRGHRLIRIPEESDYDGTDAFMRTHNPKTTFAEPGQIDFQLKATDSLHVVDSGKSVTCRVETCHLQFWVWGTYYPFILILYDAQENRGFWLDVKKWANDADRGAFNRCLEEDQKTLVIRIPTTNRLAPAAIDHFRSMLLASIPDNKFDG